MSVNLENVKHESAQEDEDGVDNQAKRFLFKWKRNITIW